MNFSAGFPVVLSTAMIVGIGSDVLEVARMERELCKPGSSIKDDVFTPAEIAYCEGKRYPARHFAARFAAKEAVFKALSLDGAGGLRLRQVEVCNDGLGRPRVELFGTIRQIAESCGVARVFVSLSHTDELATANVVLESDDPRAGTER
jgi:holo-[acyl-carrier protein] synthase